MIASSAAYERRVEPLATGWRSFAWRDGTFDMARRPYTEAVEGRICTPFHLVLVTLSGGAERQDVRANCGHRYSGIDRPGAVSFIPADCERFLRLRGVESAWATVALRPSLLRADVGQGWSLDGATFTNQEDPFLYGAVAELARLHAAGQGLEPLYCEAMSAALARYLVRRYGRTGRPAPTRPVTLAPWRLRRITDHVEAHLGDELRITDLAVLARLSPGHLHRAFRASTGRTPLQFINERRVQRAKQLILAGPKPILEIAANVGFMNPSYFSRVFRRITGLNPADYRTQVGDHQEGSP